MPLIGTTFPSGPPAASSDGYLTVTAMPQWGGVQIAVDFRNIASGAPDRVTVTRTIGTATVKVLGLDYYPSPKAYTIGFDGDAPMGQACIYRATAANSYTGETWTSTTVATVSPSPDPVRGWIKSTVRPDLSVLVVVTSWPDWSFPRPQGVQYANQAEFPAVISGRRRAGTGTVGIGSMTVAEQRAVKRLLNTQGTLLLQAEVMHAGARPDVYVEAGQLTEAAAVQTFDPWRDWQFDVTQVDRPKSAGSRVTLPGHSFADLQARYGALSNYPKPLIHTLAD